MIWKYQHNNSGCERCRVVLREMVRIGNVIFCGDCSELLFKPNMSEKDERKTYLTYLDKQKARREKEYQEEETEEETPKECKFAVGDEVIFDDEKVCIYKADSPDDYGVENGEGMSWDLIEEEYLSPLPETPANPPRKD